MHTIYECKFCGKTMEIAECELHMKHIHGIDPPPAAQPKTGEEFPPRVWVSLSYLKKASTGTVIGGQSLIATTEPKIIGDSEYLSLKEYTAKLSALESQLKEARESEGRMQVVLENIMWGRIPIDCTPGKYAERFLTTPRPLAPQTKGEGG